MALTPEDVVNKRFQQTKFREGYDQDEVDDFLDEIVVELRRLLGENEELRRELDEAPKGGGPAAPVPAGDDKELAQRKAELDKREAELDKREKGLAAGPKEPVAVADQAAAGAGTQEDDAESSNSLLLLARRLHDEHVAEGTRRRDQLIAEGEERAKKIVADAELTAKNVTTEGETRARQLVSDAERTERETVGRAEETKQKIEARVEELRLFEREYRNKLRSFIEGNLNDLNKQSSMIEPQGPAGQQQ